MNNSQQAKNGFKTFILTFGISLLVFGFFYYLLSDVNSGDVTIETDETEVVGYTKVLDDTVSAPKPEPETTPDVSRKDAGPSLPTVGPTISEKKAELPSGIVDDKDKEKVSNVTVPEPVTVAGPTVAGVTTKNVGSPFGDLVNNKPDVRSQEVLAGADESTQSTAPVPETGDFSITLALLTSTALLGFFVYILFLNPRNYALSKFEERVLEDLEE